MQYLRKHAAPIANSVEVLQASVTKKASMLLTYGRRMHKTNLFSEIFIYIQSIQNFYFMHCL